MGWNLTQLEIDRPGSPASSFSFELQLEAAQPGRRIVTGDGVVLPRIGKVIVNRERELRSSLSAVGADDQRFISELSDRVLRQLGESTPAAA